MSDTTTPAKKPTKTLQEQLACAGRELALRKNVYPKWVATGRMTMAKANHEIECMDEIVKSLKMLDSLLGQMLMPLESDQKLPGK